MGAQNQWQRMGEATRVWRILLIVEAALALVAVLLETQIGYRHRKAVTLTTQSLFVLSSLSRVWVGRQWSRALDVGELRQANIEYMKLSMLIGVSAAVMILLPQVPTLSAVFGLFIVGCTIAQPFVVLSIHERALKAAAHPDARLAGYLVFSLLGLIVGGLVMLVVEWQSIVGVVILATIWVGLLIVSVDRFEAAYRQLGDTSTFD